MIWRGFIAWLFQKSPCSYVFFAYIQIVLAEIDFSFCSCIQFISPHVGAELTANSRKSLRKCVKNPASVAVSSLNGRFVGMKMKKQNVHIEVF